MQIPSGERGDWFVPGTELIQSLWKISGPKETNALSVGGHSLEGQVCYNDHSWVPHPVVGLISIWVAMCWICAGIVTQTWSSCHVWYATMKSPHPDAMVDDAYRLVVWTPCCLADCHKPCRDQLIQCRQCVLCHVALTTDGKTNDDLMDASDYIFMRRERTLNDIRRRKNFSYTVVPVYESS